jgi:hypothetical protein
VDSWYGRSGSEVECLSQRGREWAEAHSWEVLRPRYLEALEKLVES